MDDERLQSLLQFRNRCTSFIEKLEELNRDNSHADKYLMIQIEIVLNALRETALGDYFDSMVAQNPPISVENSAESGAKWKESASIYPDNKKVDSSTTTSEQVTQSCCEPSE